MKRQQHRRVPSRRGIGRNVGDAELLMVLQRRRNVMGENQDQSPLTQTQGQSLVYVPHDVSYCLLFVCFEFGLIVKKHEYV